MERRPDYYQILQVSPAASPQTIKTAYRRLAKKHHPDLGGDMQQMALLNEAYQTLSSPSRRMEYDRHLAEKTASREKAPATAADDILRGEQPSAEAEVLQTRPGIRLFARLLDVLLSLTLGIAVMKQLLAPGTSLAAVYSSLLHLSPNGFLLALLLTWAFLSCLMILLEALLLSSLKQTCGKWLLQTFVYDLKVDRLSFGRVLRRCILVWLKGLAAGIPLLIPFALALAYRDLAGRGCTSWDEAESFFVAHRPAGAIRITAAALFLLLLCFSLFQLIFGQLIGFGR